MNEFDIIRKKIRQHMNEIADDLAGGAAIDYPNYRYLVGMISGLAIVEREILDILERAERED